MTTLDKLIAAGIYSTDQPLRLHLGCGQTYLQGYINIDHPPEQHFGYTPTVDAYGDIRKLVFPENSVDEIRLHHVFEHFDRITAIVLLVKWHSWLKLNGVLIIETPDFKGSINDLINGDQSYSRQMAIVRHLEGDQTAAWAAHIGQWWDKRFEHTLSKLGFTIRDINYSKWDRPPYLRSVTVTSKKLENILLTKQIEVCYALLKDSLVSEREIKTYQIWCGQLREKLDVGIL